jgi:hypothetical protein
VCVYIYVAPYSGPLPINRNLPIRRQFCDRRHIGRFHGNAEFLAGSAYMALIQVEPGMDHRPKLNSYLTKRQMLRFKIVA